MFRFVLIFAVLWTGSPVALAAKPFPHFAHQQAEVFAICSGRLSAFHVRQKVDHDPDAAATGDLRIAFDDLLDAVSAAAYDQGVPMEQPKRWKSRGWSEVSSLLHAAEDPEDRATGRAAEARLATRLDECRQLILPS